MLNEAAEDSNELFKGLKPALILIDFGVSIDMRLLPKDAKFNFKFEKADNLIPEMLENKQWNYQVGVNSSANSPSFCTAFPHFYSKEYKVDLGTLNVLFFIALD